jgi:hypothetical protein
MGLPPRSSLHKPHYSICIIILILYGDCLTADWRGHNPSVHCGEAVRLAALPAFARQVKALAAAGEA